MKAEELLSNEQNTVKLNGQEVRKGTIGSFMLNCQVIIQGSNDTQVKEDLKKQTTFLKQIGFFDIGVLVEK